MTTPMPVYLEPWINSPPVPVLGPAAGVNGAGQGISQPWVMGGNWAAYPVAQPAPARPPRLFRMFDPADPREIIWVTDTGGAHTAPTANWQVTRSAEGSVPQVPHAPGFELRPFLTKASLDGRARGTPNGLTWRNGLNPEAPTVPYSWTAGSHVLTQVEIPQGEAIEGSLYEIHAWGYYNGGVPPAPVTTAVNLGVDWVNPGPPLTRVVIGGAGHAVAGVSGMPLWRVHAALNIHGQIATAATCSVSVMFWCAVNGTNQALTVPVLLFGNIGSPTNVNTGPQEPVINTSTNGLFRLYCNKVPDGNIMTLLGTRAGRAA
jgi:hypothetical protein